MSIGTRRVILMVMMAVAATLMMNSLTYGQGIEEKRWVKRVQDEIIPNFVRQCNEITGGHITFEVKHETFSGDLEAYNNIEGQGFQEVMQALAQISRDDVGKQALAKGLKKVVIVNVKDAKQKSASCKNGVLEVKGAFAQGLEGRLPDSDIAKVLEAAL